MIQALRRFFEIDRHGTTMRREAPTWAASRWIWPTRYRSVLQP